MPNFIVNNQLEKKSTSKKNLSFIYIQGAIEHVWPTSRVDCTPKHHKRGSYKRTLHLSSFMRRNEVFILILCYLIIFTEDFQNDRVIFQSKPANVLSWIRLHSQWFQVFPELVKKPVLFWTLVFPHFQQMLLCSTKFSQTKTEYMFL